MGTVNIQLTIQLADHRRYPARTLADPELAAARKALASGLEAAIVVAARAAFETPVPAGLLAGVEAAEVLAAMVEHGELVERLKAFGRAGLSN